MRFKSAHVVIVGTLLVVASLALAGALLLRGGEPSSTNAQGDLATERPTPSTTETSTPSASPTAAAAPSPSPSPPKPKPKPSPKPVSSPVPAPPPPPVEPSGCVPHYEGTNVPKDQVGAALDAAAAKHFWTVSQVTLPPNLIKAIAEQESGWQSAIISCIGAIGAMQVVPATADWMNGRFATSYNLRDVQGNAMLGSEFLQWLIKYFADRYFNGQQGDYALRTSDCSQDPDIADYKEWCLLNAVISAYNVGHGTVDKSATDDVPGYYINNAYLESVRALMNKY
jgi:hypothetical protein